MVRYYSKKLEVTSAGIFFEILISNRVELSRATFEVFDHDFNIKRSEIFTSLRSRFFMQMIIEQEVFNFSDKTGFVSKTIQA